MVDGGVYFGTQIATLDDFQVVEPHCGIFASLLTYEDTVNSNNCATSWRCLHLDRSEAVNTGSRASERQKPAASDRPSRMPASTEYRYLCSGGQPPPLRGPAYHRPGPRWFLLKHQQPPNQLGDAGRRGCGERSRDTSATLCQRRRDGGGDAETW